MGWSGALAYLLAAPDRREAEQREEQLYRSLFRKVIHRVVWEEMQCDLPTTLEAQDQENYAFEDLTLLVRGRIAVRLLSLWEARHALDGKGVTGTIAHLRAYIMAAARYACVDFFRQEYPGRHALNNSLRVAFDVRADLALWQAELSEGQEEWRCGRPEWEEQSTIPLRLSTSQRMLLTTELEGLDQAEALSHIFEVVKGPLRFTELLGFLAEFWDVEATHRREMRESAEFRVPKGLQEGLQPEGVAERIGTYQNIWALVRRLAPAQVAVLLLKAPASGAGNELLEMVRLDIMDWWDLASVMGLPAERLHQIAPNVPLEDREIAALIGVTREEVPRIRQDAHRRLARWRERLKK